MDTRELSDAEPGVATTAAVGATPISEDERQLWRKRLHRAALGELLASERERERLANDLHDDLGQLLALIRLKICALREQLHPRAHAANEEIDDLVHQATRRVASLSFQLHPPALEEEGLETAVRWLIEALGESHGLRAELVIKADLAALDRVTRIMAFRCLRELLLNVAKHTTPKCAVVTIGRTEGHLELVVEDRGEAKRGSTTGRGFGLAAMRERLCALGGSLEFERGLGLPGTRARVRLPASGNAGSDSDRCERER